MDNDYFDGKRTILRPRPGGDSKRPPAVNAATVTDDASSLMPASSPTPPSTGVIVDWSEILPVYSSLNPLLHAAATLLSLTSELRRWSAVPEGMNLFEVMTNQLQHFQQRAKQARYAPADIHCASEFFCCFVDETVRKMPWREQTQWAQQSLLFTLHAKNVGGDYFFVLSEQLLNRHDKSQLPMLEIGYTLLSLGFQGRYGLANNGQQHLLEWHNRFYQQILSFRGEPEKALSVHWKGVNRPQEKLGEFMPLWLSMGGGLVLLIVFYTTFLLKLSSAANPVMLDMISLGNILNADDNVLAEDVLARPALPVTITLSDLLADHIIAGSLAVEKQGRYEVIILEGDRYFASGSGAITSQNLGVLSDIRKALETLPGSVVISGHTDNIPMRSLQFPSNWHLSKARAQSVADALDLSIHTVSIKPMAESSPRVANDSADNRARNRRVEIMLLSQPPVER